jgi:hypothetical protein
MSVAEVRAFTPLTSNIAVQAGSIVYVDTMVAESVAFRAGRNARPVQSDSVRNRRLSADGGTPGDGDARGQGDVGRPSTVAGAE